MATARKPAAKKSARKTATKATKKSAKKAATKRTTAKKAATKRTTAKKAATKRTPAKKAASKRTPTKKAAPKRTAAKKAAPRRTAAKKAITPKQALANTRKLLAQKQARARATPPWQALDGHQEQVPHSGFQSDGARVQAEELHEAEARLQGNHGSISTHDRHNQGKRDQRS